MLKDAVSYWGYTASVIYERKGMERQWNDTDWWKFNYSEINLIGTSSHHSSTRTGLRLDLAVRCKKPPAKLPESLLLQKGRVCPSLMPAHNAKKGSPSVDRRATAVCLCFRMFRSLWKASVRLQFCRTQYDVSTDVLVQRQTRPNISAGLIIKESKYSQ